MYKGGEWEERNQKKTRETHIIVEKNRYNDGKWSE